MPIKHAVLDALLKKDSKNEGWNASRAWFPSQKRQATQNLKTERDRQPLPPTPKLPVRQAPGYPPQPTHAPQTQRLGTWDIVVFGLAGLIVLAVVVMFVIVLIKHDDPGSTGNGPLNTPTTSSGTSRPAYTVVPALVGDDVVSATDLAFEPPVVSLKVGDKLQVDGASLSDPVELRVNERNVGQLGPQSIVIRFDKAGTYRVSSTAWLASCHWRSAKPTRSQPSPTIP